ncbi:MAG: UDP-2,3-diacylglucosamine diphosphatase, partial [Bacteroidota bacterium]
GDYGYKILKRIFANRICQFLFARLHPNFSFGIAQFWSRSSRASHPAEDKFLGTDDEWLLVYANEQLDKEPADFYVFGHRHLPIDHTLKNGTSRYINLGEWMHYNSYAVFDGQEMKLCFFENESGFIFENGVRQTSSQQHAK